MQVLWPLYSQRGGGGSASDQKSRGKGRQLATSGLYKCFRKRRVISNIS